MSTRTLEIFPIGCQVRLLYSKKTKPMTVTNVEGALLTLNHSYQCINTEVVRVYNKRKPERYFRSMIDMLAARLTPNNNDAIRFFTPNATTTATNTFNSIPTVQER